MAMTINEPWVDMKTLAKHLGFSYNHTAKLVKEGYIPGMAMPSGSRTLWRFRLSTVDDAMERPRNSQPPTELGLSPQ